MANIADTITIGSKPPREIKRAAMWSLICGVGIFTLADIVHFTGADRRAVGRYIKDLEAAGIAETIREAKGLPTIYRLKRTDLLEAPETGQAMLWRSARILKTFTACELVATLDVDDGPPAWSTAKRWLTLMKRVGLIRQSGSRGQVMIYRLARDLGPKAPMILRGKHVWDPNAGEVLGDRS